MSLGAADCDGPIMDKVEPENSSPPLLSLTAVSEPITATVEDTAPQVSTTAPKTVHPFLCFFKKEGGGAAGESSTGTASYTGGGGATSVASRTGTDGV